jgi:hypothetical protein
MSSNESPEQHLQEEQESEQNASESMHTEDEEDEGLHSEDSENQRRAFEFPLSVSAGIGYAATGIWMILDKRNSKVPYIIAIIGSMILLGIYVASRTVGLYSLGTEAIGIFDAIVAGFQVAIIASSSYILITKLYNKGTTVGK